MMTFVFYAVLQAMALLTGVLSTFVDFNIRQIGSFCVVLIIGFMNVYLK